MTKIEMEMWVDGYNCGYGKKIRKVIYCKKAKEYVIAEKDGNKWFCLHELI
jgi:hypothetical protein